MRAVGRYVTVALAVALSTAACVSPLPARFIRYDGEEIDPQGFRQASYRCVQESRQSWSAGGSGLIGLSLMASAQADAQSRANQMYVQCMGASGYQPVWAK